MNTINLDTQVIEKEVVHIISAMTSINPDRLVRVRDLTQLGLDILDVVDIILEVEKAYHLIIPDEVPVYTVDDFVNYVYSQRVSAAKVKPEQQHAPGIATEHLIRSN